MQKLNFQTIKLKGTIISPIHIWGGDVYGRLSYFVDGDKLLVVSENWLTLCAEKEKDLFSDIVNSIKEGNFLKLEKLKLKFFENYFDKNLINEEIDISQGALDYLLMKDIDYSTRKDGMQGNQGEVKKFIKSKFGKEIIPGSTLKGLIKSIILQSLKSKNGNYIEEAKKLEKLLNGKLKFQSAFFEVNDVELKNFKKQIQFLQLNVKDSNSGIPLVFETITEGEFEFEILYDTNIADFLNDFEKLLSVYSLGMIEREQRVFGSKRDLNDFLDKLDDYFAENVFPVKIGMYKKSLTYKVYWEEILDDVYQKLVDLLDNLHNTLKQEYNSLNSKSIIKAIWNSIDETYLAKFYEENKLWEFGFIGSKGDFSKKKEDGKKFFIKWVRHTVQERFNKTLNKYVLKFAKPTQVVGQKLGVGDRSFYITEDGLPVGWIALEIIS